MEHFHYLGVALQAIGEDDWDSCVEALGSAVELVGYEEVEDLVYDRFPSLGGVVESASPDVEEPESPF